MKRIKLMADYQCYPLWWADGDRFGDIDPKRLPLSEALIKDLMAWATSYDQTLKVDEPDRSGFATATNERLFVLEGQRLLERLRIELEGVYSVDYFYQ